MIKKKNNLLLNTAILLVIFVIVFYLLYIWANLLIPFIIAILFSFAIIWLSNTYKKLSLSPSISFILSLSTYILIFWLVWKLIWSNIDELYTKLPFYQDNIKALVEWIFQFFGIYEPKPINSFLDKLDLPSIFTLIIETITSIFSSTWIILFYTMFILLEYRYFKEKLQLMINNNIRKNEILVILDKIKRDTKSYFVIKTGVSFITAFISYIIMISFWLDFAIFWAFLIFCLNFIPSIWSVIAVSFPIVLSLLQFNNLFVVTIMWLLLVFIQILMWNIIEPKFMWNKLNLSPLVIIVSLTFWWSIWWLAWMILAVPIMVIINIILAKIPSTKNLAILLSEKWELEVDGGESILKTRRKLFKYMKDLIKKYNKTF